MLNDDSSIKWQAQKAFNINEVSNAAKIATIFVFLYEILIATCSFLL